ERVGRKELVNKIGIGEGSIRTILKILKEKNLIESNKKGHILNENGIKELNKYMEKFSLPFKIYSNDIGNGCKVGIIVHNCSDKISYAGMEERDEAIRNKANKALILIYDKKEKIPFRKLKFPNDVYLIDEFSEFIRETEKIEFKEGDVLVVTFADNYIDAENSAVAVGLYLSKKIKN
ncbi:MAG: DUF4443 domain-containing protein, partial [Candidatus Altarchaeaceae archaeon]